MLQKEGHTYPDLLYQKDEWTPHRCAGKFLPGDTFPTAAKRSIVQIWEQDFDKATRDAFTRQPLQVSASDQEMVEETNQKEKLMASVADFGHWFPIYLVQRGIIPQEVVNDGLQNWGYVSGRQSEKGALSKSAGFDVVDAFWMFQAKNYDPLFLSHYKDTSPRYKMQDQEGAGFEVKTNLPVSRQSLCQHAWKAWYDRDKEGTDPNNAKAPVAFKPHNFRLNVEYLKDGKWEKYPGHGRADTTKATPVTPQGEEKNPPGEKKK